MTARATDLEPVAQGKTMARTSIAVSAVTLGAAILAIPGIAAAGKAAEVPVITKVAPMRVKVGGTVTIRGKYFSRRRNGNTVVFKGSGGRLAIAKPKGASTTKLVVTVPASAERVLTPKSGQEVPTRLTLRVITKRYGKVSSRRHSPIVVTALASG